MPRIQNVLYNACFALNCLLLFLLLFESRIQVPAFLQVIGRMHPLFLHFPIVLLLLALGWELVFRRQWPQAEVIGDGLLLVTAFTAVLTSLMGLFLSFEEGYDPEQLGLHKWGGITVSVLSLVWFQHRQRLRTQKVLVWGMAMIAAGALLITGHQGASLTHGDNYLSGPLIAAYQPEPVLFEDALVYTHMVQPILETKCVGCHNEKKAKGDLVMTSYDLLLKGGQNGALWDSTDGDYGLLLHRVHLPLANKKHMPPQGKPQLEDEEIEIIKRWIRCGASYTTRVADLPETDSLRLLAAQMFNTLESDHYDFAPADPGKLAQLNNNYRLVQPLAAGSPALGVSFFGASQFQSQHLAELLPIKKQIVSLSLNGMPVTNSDLKVVAQCAHLRKLNLSFTKVSDEGLSQLAHLQELKHLSLSGTATGKAIPALLQSLPGLRKVELWQTGCTPAQLQQMEAAFTSVRLEGGFNGDTIVMRLNPPVIDHEEVVVTDPVPLKLRHFIQGVIVRYTTDGSEPDSIHSPRYTGNIMLDDNVTIKARAFKPGWISSGTVEKQFFRSGIRPDSIRLLVPPDPQYKGGGSETLVDARKGDLNFRSGMWLGYREQPLEALLFFTQSREVRSLALSTLVDVNGYIMPPQSIELWGGANARQLRLLGKLQPAQPREMASAKLSGAELSFAPVSVKVLKLVVKPLSALPAWHPGKGQKGWVFLDEVFIN